MKLEKQKVKRRWWFRCVKCFLRLFVRKPKLITENEELDTNAIYLCNHVGKKAPIKLELYFPHNFKFWGRYENAVSGKLRWKLLAKEYYPQRFHINKFFSAIIATIVWPFVTIFYTGMRLIPTYKDSRFISTIKTSVEHLKSKSSVIIFPEYLDDGFYDEMRYFHPGFLELAKRYYEKTKHNIKIYTMYFRKQDNALIIGKPRFIEEILASGKNIREVAQEFKDNTNEIAKLQPQKN